MITNVDKTLKKAGDPDVFKGLIAYLNWQDKLVTRLQTPKQMRYSKSASKEVRDQRTT